MRSEVVIAPQNLFNRWNLHLCQRTYAPTIICTHINSLALLITMAPWETTANLIADNVHDRHLFTVGVQCSGRKSAIHEVQRISSTIHIYILNYRLARSPQTLSNQHQSIVESAIDHLTVCFNVSSAVCLRTTFMTL